ncbi:MAG: hypothetical protein C4278_01115 [Patescibacteria group bacterium]
MMTPRDLKNFIIDLYNLGERQFEKERMAKEMIEERLKSFRIPYTLEKFTTSIPLIEKAILKLDGRPVPCVATSMVSGNINNPNHLISSLTSSQNFLFVENINFNPLCPKISRSNHYFAPAIAVPRYVVPKIFRAKKIIGKVRVKKTNHLSANILVGNWINPRYLIFSHYDSIYGGAVDNASGTALSLFLAVNNSNLLKQTLFVFSGNEELSYDKPIYWGHGYRVFEERHKHLLEKAKKILILDCLGFSKTFFINKEEIVRLGFPVNCLQKIISKTWIVAGDIQKLMRFYHSELDKPSLISEKELVKAAAEIISKLR